MKRALRTRSVGTKVSEAEQRVMEEASRRWGVELEPERSRRAADSAVTYARERGIERAAVVDERALLRDALNPSTGALYFLHDDILGTPQIATDAGQTVKPSHGKQATSLSGRHRSAAQSRRTCVFLDSTSM